MANLLKKVLPFSAECITWLGNTYAAKVHNHDSVYVKQGEVDAIPVGTIVQAYHALPGFLACSGTAVSRTTYAALFAKLGIKCGVGDGSTTFNLPSLPSTTNAINRTAVGGISANGEWATAKMNVDYDASNVYRGIHAFCTAYQGSMGIQIPIELRPCTLVATITKSAVFPERLVLYSGWQVTRNLDGKTGYQAAGGDFPLANYTESANVKSISMTLTTAATHEYMGLWSNQGVTWDSWLSARLVCNNIAYRLAGAGSLACSAGYDRFSSTSGNIGTWIPENSGTISHYIKY